MWSKLFFLVLAFVPALVHSLAATDEITDADAAQSGYLDNHNLHPATVGSSVFGILWKNKYGAKEKWYAKPLVYTPPGSSQIVFLASSMNVLRVLDAVNGTLLNSRTVQPPFLQSDIGCGDIPDYIGVIGTPVIDPNTNTAYFFSKGYRNGASNGGLANGIYQFYAVDVLTLADQPGFPILIDGHFADNDNARYFIGGTVLQRPSVALINGVVVGAFGGHCDLFNYTGMLVTVSTAPGVGVVSLYAMESSPGAPTTSLELTVEKGGKAGIWQSGMGLATDGSRIFLATGNGQGHANGDVPASGRTPLSTLDEVVGNFAISSTGKIALTDYFEPYEYISMDAGDRDLGSSGVALLDSTVFSGTGVSKMAITIGKNGKAYILNANNLGGFKQGSGGVDNIIQTISIGQGSVFGGAGSYPMEGGYIYFTPIGQPTVCYKMGHDSAGAPYFTLVGQTAANAAGRVGIGLPTITTYKGQAGTAILWVTDPTSGLQAFNAVPVNGILAKIPLPATGGLSKFQRPAFGDSRVYVSDTNGNVICMGSPVSLPLDCSQPVDFGSVTIGDTATRTINCTALIAITSINGCTTGDSTWQCSNSSLPQGALAKGATFSFPVTWNLTQASIEDRQNASYGKVLPGVASTSLDIYTTNSVAKYSNVLPISLTGTTVSSTAYLTINPPSVDLGGVVVGSQAAASGLSASVILANIGADTLTFLGSAWTSTLSTVNGPIAWTNITNGDLGASFSSSNLPKGGDTLAPGTSLTIPVGFISNITGDYSTFVEWWTTGGNGDVMLTASASTAPIANISISTIEGGWDFSDPVIMDFGNVLAGTTVSRSIRICNAGGSALLITKSKPPITMELLAPNSNVDLHEGQTIDVNSCTLGQVSIVAAPLGVDRLAHTVSDVWILNTDDVKFGVHDVQITANIVTRQVGPLMANGSSEYLYLGCYYDGGGRVLAKQFNNATNENGWCQTTCFNAGYQFAGTEYHTQCWCGNTAPPAAKYTQDSLKKCAFSCPGDVSQACGGDGTFISIYYDRTKYVPGADSIPGGASSSSSSSVVSSTTVSSSTDSSTSISTSSASSLSSSGGTSSTSLSSTLSSTSVSSSSTDSSSTSLSTSSVSSTVISGSSSVSSTSSTSASATPTGPVIIQNAGNFAYIGCYTESTTGRALTGLTYANDNMTIEICAAKCAAFTYFGVEYHRECYCGNTLGAGSVQTVDTGCSMTCMANNFEYCGGSKKLSMYQLKAAVSSSSQSSSSAALSSSSSQFVSSSSSISSDVSSSSSSSSSVLSSTSSDVLSSTSSSSSAPSSTSSDVLSSSSSSSSGPSSTSSSDGSTSTSSSSTQDSTSSTSSPTSSTSETSSSSSDLSSTSTLSSSSSSSSTLSSTSTTTLVTITSSSSSSVSPTPTSTVPTFRGFAYTGCYSDPAGGPYGGHNMPKLFSNDSMTPDLCISSALARLSATPATTYLYAGVEYGRECYAGSVAPTPEPTRLVGPKACTMTCLGDKSQKCGAGKMYDLYVATQVTVTGTNTNQWSAPAPTSTIA